MDDQERASSDLSIESVGQPDSQPTDRDLGESEPQEAVAELSPRALRDLSESEESKLPPGEQCLLKCVWVLEAYTPSNASRLSEAFERFGWDMSAHGGGPALNDALARSREAVGGGGWSWWNLGHVFASGYRGIGRQTNDLVPEGTRAIRASILSCAPSVTFVCWQFVLSETAAPLFERALSLDLKTVQEPHPGGGQSIIRPAGKRRDLVGAAREELYERYFSFVGQHFPGVFSDGLLRGEYPSCELLTLSNARPFRDDPKDVGTFLDVLGLTRSFVAWESKALEGVFLESPRRNRSDSATLMLSSNLEDFAVANQERLKMYGTDADDGITAILQDFDYSLAAWSCWVLLEAYAQRLGELRDRAATSTNLPLDQVHELTRDALGLTADAVPIARDLIAAAQDRGAFLRDVKEFVPLKGSTKATDGFFGWATRDIDRLGQAVLDRVGQIETVLSNSTSLLNAQAGLSLQRQTLILTWVLLGVGLVTIVVTIWAVVSRA